MPPLFAAVAITTFALCAASWAMWAADPDATARFALVASSTAVAGAVVALIAPRDPWLAAAIVTVIPVAGPLVALWIISLRGAAGTGACLLWDPSAAPAAIDGAELARRLTRILPPCEALATGDAELRRATIGRLAARATPDDIALLRWARRRDRELAVEIALAFEDLDERMSAQLRAARAAAATRPAADTHAALISLIARAVLAKLADPPLVPALAAEARHHHRALAALDGERARELSGLRAQLDRAAGHLDTTTAGRS